jgi:hypothetical protein
MGRKLGVCRALGLSSDARARRHAHWVRTEATGCRAVTSAALGCFLCDLLQPQPLSLLVPQLNNVSYRLGPTSCGAPRRKIGCVQLKMKLSGVDMKTLIRALCQSCRVSLETGSKITLTTASRAMLRLRHALLSRQVRGLSRLASYNEGECAMPSVPGKPARTRRGFAADTPSVSTNTVRLAKGDQLHGFTVTAVDKVPDLHLAAVQLTHDATGARYRASSAAGAASPAVCVCVALTLLLPLQIHPRCPQ